MEEPNAIPDAELLRQALAGDELAFRALYERLKRGVFRYAFYMTNSRSAAEEVLQEVFMTLLEKGKSFNPAQGDLGAFTFGLARNIVRRVERRERSWRARFHDGGLDETHRLRNSSPATCLNLNFP